MLRANPWNAVVAAGHGDGTVTMWTPNLSTPVAKLAAHRAPVTALAFDAGGRYMVSAGADARLKVWDIRRWAEVHDYFTPTPARSVDISARGYVAVGYGSHVTVWGPEFALEGARGRITDAMPGLPSREGGDGVKAGAGAGGGAGAAKARHVAAAAAAGVSKAASPYLRHDLPGRPVSSVRFRPFEDSCAVGHASGIATLIVPGAGEPNYDTSEADPFAGKRARADAEVRALLDKLPATTIALDPAAVGALDPAPRKVREAEAHERTAAARSAAAEAKANVAGKKRRGIRKALKRAGNVVTEERMALQDKIREEDIARRAATKNAQAENPAGGALSRFFEKKKGAVV